MTTPLELFDETMTEMLAKNKRFLLQRPSYAIKFMDIAKQMKKQPA